MEGPQHDDHMKGPEHDEHGMMGERPEGEHGQILAAAADTESASVSSNYTMDRHAMMFVVLMFAVATMVQLYNCWTSSSRKNGYKRIGDEYSVDALQFSA